METRTTKTPKDVTTKAIKRKETAEGLENDELVAKLLLSEAVMWLIYKGHIAISKWARLHSLMVIRYAAFLTRNNLSDHPHEDAALALGFSSRKKYDDCKKRFGL